MNLQSGMLLKIDDNGRLDVVDTKDNDIGGRLVLSSVKGRRGNNNNNSDG